MKATLKLSAVGLLTLILSIAPISLEAQEHKDQKTQAKAACCSKDADKNSKKEKREARRKADLEKYDRNKDGKLDKAEREAKKADKKAEAEKRKAEREAKQSS
jgi:hypothetical protein